MQNNQRLGLVNSLYGPGTVGGWLLVAISVLVSWTINPQSQSQDSITNDLVATLIFTLVAVGNFLYQFIKYSPAIKIQNVPYDPKAVEFLPRIASIEAALNVCETSASLMLVLFTTAVLHGHRKRAFSVFVTGILVFTTQIYVFVKGPDITPRASYFTRPFLFNLTPLFVAIMTILSSLVPVMMATWICSPIAQRRSDRNRLEPEDNPPVLNADDNGRKEVIAARRLVTRLYRHMSLVLVSATSFATFGTSIGIFGQTLYETLLKPSASERLLFFIPRSSSSIMDLDQAVALGAGLCTSGFSIWDAFREVCKPS